MRIIIVVGAMIGMWATTALACDGQKGKVLYEDTFADDAGGWIASNNFTVKAPGAEVSIAPGIANTFVNQTFFFSQADYCLEVAFPREETDISKYSVGLRFLSSEEPNGDHYLAILSSACLVKLLRSSKSSPDYAVLWVVDEKSNANLAPGAFNAIEAIVKNSNISVLLNGKLVKNIRAQIPASDSHFGFYFYLQSDAGLKAPGVFSIKSIKVTEAQ